MGDLRRNRLGKPIARDSLGLDRSLHYDMMRLSESVGRRGRTKINLLG